MTPERSTPCSRAILAADGAGGRAGASATAAPAPTRPRRGGGATGAARGAGRGAPAPSAIWPSSAPGVTVSPSLASTRSSTPAAGAFTSRVTLSVSSSTSGSSAATASPAFLNQRPIVASVTDSPSVGTRISVMITPPPKKMRALKRPRRERPAAAPDAWTLCPPPSRPRRAGRYSARASILPPTWVSTHSR